MRLLTLTLKDFRNYKEASVSFEPGLNIISGDNAQGKSNILEAIYLLMTGRSFRTTKLKELIRWGAEYFTLKATFIKHDIEQSLTIGYNGQEKRIFHNDTPLPSFSSLLGILQGHILSPEDRDLISGPPSTRRRFLDLHLSQIDAIYLQTLSRYYRALKQRNHLLRTRQTETITTWEEQMAACATYLTEKRKAVIANLHLQTEDQITLTYRPSRPAWDQHLAQELILGHTLTGPHRDDLHISCDNHQMRTFGSEGQKISTSIALRFAQLEVMRNEKPLMLIDDVAGSLDEKREATLIERLSHLEQVFFTTPRAKESHFKIVQGTIEEQSVLVKNT